MRLAETLFEEQLKILRAVLEVCETMEPKQNAPTKSLDAIELIANRFDIVARTFKNRHNGRPTIEVADEYDVQDLLHALLKIYYQDIRPEEWAPSYAGRSSRVDFLLKKEKTVIEVKMAREGLKDIKIGEQLIIDTIKYQSHPDRNRLVCFVYDPKKLISNPAGLQNDLNSSTNEFSVDVFIIQ